MFLNNINWRHIIGALVSGIVLNIAGIIGFWTFLGLVVLAIIIALLQYLPIGRRTATAILLIGVMVAIGIPSINVFMRDRWPATSKALQKQDVATDLKTYEALNQPGFEGIKRARWLAEQKEQARTAIALRHFEQAATHVQTGRYTEAAEAERLGREELERAIQAREADAEYIKDKLRSAKAPATWWRSVKNFFTQVALVGMTAGTLPKSFPVRLLILGLILLIAGTLVFRRLSSGFGGIVVLLGGIAIIWGMFLLVTPEIAPAPPGSWPSIGTPGRQAAMPTSRQWAEVVHLQPGVWSAKVFPPRGTAFDFEGPPDGSWRIAGNKPYSLGASDRLEKTPAWNRGVEFFSPTGGKVKIYYRRT